jgi:hypothetical protein
MAKKNNSKKQSQVKEDDNTAAFYEFVNEFKGESDRAAVIIGAAKLDYMLYQILAKYLIPNAGNSDDLLDGDSPLSTFSSRINICYRLGILDAGFARALHLIRRIRNSFAHEISGGKLDSGPHRDRIKELAAPYAQAKAYSDTKKAIMHNKAGAAADFFTVLSILVLRLEAVFEDIEALSPENSYGLFPPGEYVSPYKDEEET